MKSINRAISLGMGLAVLLSSFSAIASPTLARPETPPPMPTKLPGLVARRIKLDLARRVNVPASELRVVSTAVASWSNDCLDLAYIDESCQPKRIQGWNIFIREGETFNGWQYRSDRTGRRLRLDLNSQSGQSNFSTNLSRKLLHTASEQLQQPITSLRIGNIESVAWENGCLGIIDLKTACTQSLIPGFRAIVRNESKEWVYHLSADGSQIIRNTIASDPEGKVRVFLTNKQSIDMWFSAMPDLDSQTIFQSQYRNWPENYVTTTALTADGSITVTHTDLAPEIDVSSLVEQSKITGEEVAKFQSLLEQHNFSRFDQIGYHTEFPVGFGGIYVVRGAGASVELFHAETEELPDSLQPIVEAWEAITAQI